MLPLGAIIAGGCSIVVGVIILSIIFTGNRNCFKSLRSPPSIQASEDIELQSFDGSFEQYGNLTLPSDRQPTRVGLDIMMRLIMGMVLPVNAIASTRSTDGHDLEQCVTPRLSLNLPRPSSVTPSEEVSAVMTQAEASAAALAASQAFMQNMVATYERAKEDQENLKAARQAKAAARAVKRIRSGQWVDVAREEVLGGRINEMQEEIFVIGENEDED